MAEVCSLYIGKNLDAKGLRSIRKWLQETLDKGIHPNFFEEKWNIYIKNSGMPKVAQIPGAYTDASGNVRWWLDVLVSENDRDFNLKSISQFYKRCYDCGVNHIQYSSKHVHYFTGFKKKKSRKFKKYPKKNVEVNRFEIMDLD